MAITGMPRSVRKRTVGAIASPPSSFTAAAPLSFISRAALRNACSGLARTAERHVDHDQRLIAAAHHAAAWAAIISSVTGTVEGRP